MGNSNKMNKDSVSQIYDELRDEFIIIGLTGAVGSGCTKSANLLSTSDLSNEITEKISADELFNSLSCKATENGLLLGSLEKYRLRKIKHYFHQREWKPFYHIKVSNLIFCLLFNQEAMYKNPIFKIDKWLNQDTPLENIQALCQRICSIIFDQGDKTSDLKEELNHLDEIVKKIDKNGDYTEVFQQIGSDLRSNGITEYIKSDITYKLGFPKVHAFTTADFIRRTIKKLRHEGEKFFVIDALRNLHEINYFKARYSNFYLFSINADEKIRKNRLLNTPGYTEPEYNKITETEKQKDRLHSQNINECLSNGDVFISNNGDLSQLKYQLIKYVSLIRKPGLFTPSRDERNMQIALTARYNSGCISRQVGACVVGKDGYILGVGWNDVPEGSVPCLYRSTRSLIYDQNKDPEFSEYEQSSNFKEYIRNNIGSKHEPFCFKDIENQRQAKETLVKIKPENITLTSDFEKKLIKNFKNPTRERALHAEENAFLQSSKVGGGSLQDSVLYTTASPCQLCAKKAMQLGIKRIVYIDAYPDISNAQTLRSGLKDNYPKLDAFFGVAESAFMKLYKPIINIKDEVEALNS